MNSTVLLRGEGWRVNRREAAEQFIVQFSEAAQYNTSWTSAQLFLNG